MIRADVVFREGVAEHPVAQPPDVLRSLTIYIPLPFCSRRLYGRRRCCFPRSLTTVLWSPVPAGGSFLLLVSGRTGGPFPPMCCPIFVSL